MAQHYEQSPTFAHWLKCRRRALDLTQEELAARVGYASPTLQKIERGVRRPSRELAERLAHALAIPAHDQSRFLRLARLDPALPRDDAAERHEAPLAARPPTISPPVSLVGREAERAALLERLGHDHQRLITLIGPGGIGKTSLALQLAVDLAADTRFCDGVAVALFAPIATVNDVPLAILEALAIPVQRAQPAAEQLLAVLRERKLLLVLDNLEHLLSPAMAATLTQFLSRMLAEAPAVRLLATSRERLRLREEHVIDVRGLALPASDSGPRVERSAAVQLFVERAQRVAATFALDAHNRAAVAHICRRLEGLPLAIELAAAWTRALTPHEIAAEIDRSLDFLAGGDRDMPDRHRSLRAALDHSWHLLDRAEQRTLARLSVFSGGCERDATSAVVGATLPILSALIDKSLLCTASVAGTTRYTLHELVRQYAAERLASDPDDQQATALRHSAYYAELLQRWIAAQMRGSLQGNWAALNANSDNLRAAWTWAATTGDSSTVMNMALGLSLFYDTHGWVLDGAALFGRIAAALAAAPGDTRAAQGLVIGWQGYFLYRAGHLKEAARQLERGVALAQQVGSSEGLANLLLHLGSVELFSARFERAQARHAQAAHLADAANDHFTRQWVVVFQGMMALFGGDYPQAEQHLVQSLEIWRSQGFSRGIVATLLLLGETLRLAGRPSEAEAHIRDSLRLSSATRDISTVAACLRELGALALARGEWDEARYLLTESYEGMRAVGDPMFTGRSRSLLLQLEAQRGDLAAARQGCSELLGLARTGLALLLVEAAYGLALILAAENSHSEALSILIALENTPGEQITLERAAQLRADLERRLTPAACAQAAERAPAGDLLPWLEELCARGPAPTQPSLPPPAIDDSTPIVPSGALFVAETGAVLSPREVEVLRLLMAGASNRAIADTLVISLHTAKHHVASILAKLGVTTRAQAALRGRALGLAPHEPH